MSNIIIEPVDTIHISGPEPDQDKWGEEIPVWYAVRIDVFTEDEVQDWTFHSYEAVEDFARDCYAGDYEVEFEAMRA